LKLGQKYEKKSKASPVYSIGFAQFSISQLIVSIAD